jgi:hypothetical protein
MGADGGVYALDEPTGGLYLADVEHLLGLLDRLVDTGKSVIVISPIRWDGPCRLDHRLGPGHDGVQMVFGRHLCQLLLRSIHSHRPAPHGLRGYLTDVLADTGRKLPSPPPSGHDDALSYVVTETDAARHVGQECASAGSSFPTAGSFIELRPVDNPRRSNVTALRGRPPVCSLGDSRP